VIHIEKIHNPNVVPLLPSPGLIDIFLNKNNDDKYQGFCVTDTAEHYGTAVYQYLRLHNIMLADIHGVNGIPLIQLLAQQNNSDNVYYEMSIFHYASLPRRHQQLLTKKFRLILYDFMEGGETLQYLHFHPNDHDKSLALLATARDVIIITTSYENFNYLGPNVRKITLPLYAHMIVSNFTKNASIAEPTWGNVPDKLAMLMTRKPKPERLALLMHLDELNLLDNCTWSLAVNLGPSSKELKRITPVKWKHSVESPRFSKFIYKYRDKLPLLLPGETVNDFSLMTVDASWFNSHKWYVVCETDMKRHFITEKSFKGMILGMSVLTVAGAGYNQHLKKLGFQLPMDFDHLSGEERAAAVVEHMLTTQPDMNQTRHNFQLLNNHDFMVKLATQPLIDLFEL
jgi:hypothetical protein